MSKVLQTCRQIVAAGRNYAAHAKEMGNAVPAEPLLFLKATSSITLDGRVVIPAGRSVDHEVELGVVIGKAGANVRPEDAMAHVRGYVLALDMTCRDLQKAARDAGMPWSLAKGLPTFLPLSEEFAATEVTDPGNVRLWASVNGELRQSGTTRDMLWDVPRLVALVSERFGLREGDLILTGTPAGVGPVVPGDVLAAGLETDTGFATELKVQCVGPLSV